MPKVENRDNLKAKALRVCQEFLGGAWDIIALDDLRFDPLRGGLSNQLFHCALPKNFDNDSDHDDEEGPKEILMRIYGGLQSGPEVRLREITLFTLLSERSLGPKLYGLFSDGRLEEYIPSRILKWNELCTFAVPIAKELAKVHVLEFPIRKKSLFESQIYEWLDFAEKNVHKGMELPFPVDILLSGEFRKEVDWVITQVEKVNSPVLFCHNDLQGSNILLMDSPRPDGRNLKFIDYEFGAYNYRAFDITNHFNARCFDYGVSEADGKFFCRIHSDKFPNKSEQIEFIDAYLEQLIEEGVSFKDGIEAERNKILREIPIFRLAVSLYWTIGVCKFEHVSSLNIKYSEISGDDWQMYQKTKNEILSEISLNNEVQ